MRQPHLKHTQIIRLGRILNMMYKPSELAEEIKINPDTIYRSYMPAGLPHTRDEQGSVWIHGPAFVAWAKETITKKRSKRVGLPEGQAWCVNCHRAVVMIQPQIKPVNRYLEILQAKCPRCGRTVNRARARRLPLPPNSALPHLGEGRDGGTQ